MTQHVGLSFKPICQKARWGSHHVLRLERYHVIVAQLLPRMSTSHVARHSWRLPDLNTGEASKQTSTV